jgi:hypothetical protein
VKGGLYLYQPLRDSQYGAKRSLLRKNRIRINI